jgi:hypothetical protein
MKNVTILKACVVIILFKFANPNSLPTLLTLFGNYLFVAIYFSNKKAAFKQSTTLQNIL